MTRYFKNLFALASPLKTHQGYRSDIDGLRALAVCLVIGFHAFPNYLPGGFVGVDVFFIISGYLISGIIFKELNANRFSFTDFYIRRINRIFPALIIVLFSCVILSKIYLFQNEVVAFNHSLISAVVFVANIFFYNESGYFDSAAETKPLLHLWSLGIEEQFYIIWPVILVIVWKYPATRLVTLISMIILSMFINLALVKTNQPAAFYLPFSRFWELLLGSLLAYASLQKPQWLTFSISSYPHIWFKNAISILGLLLLGLSVLVLNSSKAFPGWWALLPVGASLLIIAAGKDAIFNRLVLSNRIIVFIGVISFPLYLWHWPILSFLHTQMGQAPKSYRILAVLASFILAWITYVLIERPIRFNFKSTLKPVLISFCLLSMGYYGYWDMRMSENTVDEKTAFIKYFTEYAKTNNLGSAHRYECSLTDLKNNLKSGVDPTCYEARSKHALFIWGDSHAQQLNYGISKVLPKDISILQIATFGCAPSLNFLKTGIRSSCDASNQLAFNKILIAKPNVVVLAQREHHESNNWLEISDALKKAGVGKVIIMGPVPQWEQYLYRYYARHYWDSKPRRINLNLDRAQFETDLIMKKLYRDSKEVTYISLIDRLCNIEGCLTYFGSDIESGMETFDYGHLSLTASEYVSREALSPAILSAIPK